MKGEPKKRRTNRNENGKRAKEGSRRNREEKSIWRKELEGKKDGKRRREKKWEEGG